MRMSDPDNFCPTLRPTRAAFERPFCEYVAAVFKKNPDLAMFKVRRIGRLGAHAVC